MPKPVHKPGTTHNSPPKDEDAARCTADKSGQRAALDNSRGSRARQVRRVFTEGGLAGDISTFISKYVVMPDTSVLVLAAWIIASYLFEHWDRFPHVAITSPEKRCGKSTLLDLLFTIVHNPRYTTNISPAAIYRVIEQEKPTLLMDESQSLSRRGSEQSEVTRELLNAGIGKNAKAIRCGGEGKDQIQEFSVYSPKMFASIGKLDAVLADRSLPIELRRKTKEDKVERFRSRQVEAEGKLLKAKIEKWAKKNHKTASDIYFKLEPFDIENDRMADLLLPLQAVLTADGDSIALGTLVSYAETLDAREREQEAQSTGVMLLNACREIFGANIPFMPTGTLLQSLKCRDEEPWYRWSNGEPITCEALANLLRPYGIRSSRDKKQTSRGYSKDSFTDAWQRYLPPLENLANPPNPTTELPKP